LRGALALLAPWRDDANRWVRRTVGVAVHFWAKRAHGDPKHARQVKTLLKFWLFGNCRDRQPVMHLFCGKIAWRMTAYVKNHGNSQ
jgi:hypothetical protein